MSHRLPDDPFQRLAALMVLLFVLVAVSASYWSVVRAGPLSRDLDIRRQIERELAVDRGRILAADGSVMAVTRFDGEGQAVREYPYPLLAPVTGHWTLIFGRSGLEASADDYLAGRRGQLGLDAFNDLLHETVVGADVVTTIQPDLQLTADRMLGEQRGAVIVMDPRTGAVLALASRPTYDPNQYNELAESLVVDTERPLLNRATNGLYTPGSVFKLVTLAGVLSQNLSTLGERFTNSTGLFSVGGFPIRDGSDLPRENSPYDLSHALAYSSNVTFAQLGLRLGPDGLREIGRAFGFGEAPPFDLPTAASDLGPDATLLDEVGLAVTGFGQGELLVSPLQMALVTGAIAVDGVAMQPRLIDRIVTRDGTVLLANRPRPWKRALSEGTAAQVREAMIISASDGFARAGAPEGIAIGGKTGTAQLGGTQAPHAWFVAFAPAEAPQLVVVVLVENGGAGGDVAAPIAREIIARALSGRASRAD